MANRRSPGVLQLRLNSIAIKNSSLDREYRGGLIAFYKKFRLKRANGEITVFGSKGLKARKIFECLLKRNFDYSRDFVFVDIELFSRGDNSFPYPLDPEVTWLKGYYENGSVFIDYIENKPAPESQN